LEVVKKVAFLTGGGKASPIKECSQADTGFYKKPWVVCLVCYEVCFLKEEACDVS
jgi:hypothetical protein